MDEQDPNDRSTERTVTVPAPLVTRIEERIDRTQFEEVDAYVLEAIEKLLNALEDDELARHESEEVRTEEAAAVEKQLESLGYL